MSISEIYKIYGNNLHSIHHVHDFIKLVLIPNCNQLWIVFLRNNVSQITNLYNVFYSLMNQINNLWKIFVQYYTWLYWFIYYLNQYYLLFKISHELFLNHTRLFSFLLNFISIILKSLSMLNSWAHDWLNSSH